MAHISHIQQSLSPNILGSANHIVTINNQPIPIISHSSFCDLLTFNSPIDDTIIQGFLLHICSVIEGSHAVDTNFSRDLSIRGWLYTFNKYFLHEHSSRYAKTTKLKPTLDSPSIFIPIHIHGAHWVGLICHRIRDTIVFLYSNDMNSDNTLLHIKA
jgi:hypothetical protein